MDPAAGRTRNTVRFLTAAGIGTSLLVMSGLLLTGTVIALVMATPVLVIFSPILVPVGIVALLTVAGLVVSGGFGVAAVSALAWIYNYVAGKHPVGADQLDSARTTIARKAKAVKEKAKGYGHFVQSRAHEATS